MKNFLTSYLRMFNHQPETNISLDKPLLIPRGGIQVLQLQKDK